MSHDIRLSELHFFGSFWSVVQTFSEKFNIYLLFLILIMICCRYTYFIQHHPMTERMNSTNRRFFHLLNCINYILNGLWTINFMCWYEKNRIKLIKTEWNCYFLDVKISAHRFPLSINSFDCQHLSILHSIQFKRSNLHKTCDVQIRKSTKRKWNIHIQYLWFNHYHLHFRIMVNKICFAFQMKTINMKDRLHYLP